MSTQNTTSTDDTQVRRPIGRKRPPAESAAISSACQRLRVEYWPVEKLKRYERNPRKNDRAINRMMASIKEYGFAILFSRAVAERRSRWSMDIFASRRPRN